LFDYFDGILIFLSAKPTAPSCIGTLLADTYTLWEAELVQLLQRIVSWPERPTQPLVCFFFAFLNSPLLVRQYLI
jgi:hypothetical protein